MIQRKYRLVATAFSIEKGKVVGYADTINDARKDAVKILKKNEKSKDYKGFKMDTSPIRYVWILLNYDSKEEIVGDVYLNTAGTGIWDLGRATWIIRSDGSIRDKQRF
ncbi:MAG: hypothetical protein IIY21_06145 [Clostridiales bacterium]|nr:hypothetical protein [Clostridiales bacterium]